VRQTKEIFAEYSRMRDNGLDAKAALNVLRYHIEVLSKADREALATLMRSREAAATTTNSAPAAAPAAPPAPSTLPAAPSTPPAAPPVAASPFSTAAPAPSTQAAPTTPPVEVPNGAAARAQKPNAIKPIGNTTSPTSDAVVTVTAAVPNVTPPAATGVDTDDVVWINCIHCGKTNQRHEVFCYSCGQLLEPVKGAYDTRVLNEQTSQPLDSEHFGPDSVLVLRVRGSTENYETRPQKADHELIIGRSTKGSVLAPDIDLTNRQASEMGVSRLHLSINYDAEHSAVLVSDLGSANGSFINGQRMMPKEVRVLRHGDELRLGKLVLLASFRHPG